MTTDDWRREPVNVYLPRGAIEHSAGQWRSDGDSLVRAIDYRVWAGNGWRVNLSGPQRRRRVHADRWIGSNDWTAEDPLVAQEVSAACAAAAEEVARLREDD
jgi:hypothetical protein